MSEEDLQLLITLDDPWNVQECDTFNNQQAENTGTNRPGQPEPTRGRYDHRAEDVIGNDPYQVTFGRGGWAC